MAKKAKLPPMLKRKVLIVVDMQNDFTTGALKNDVATACAEKIADFINRWPGIIVCTMDTHDEDYMNTMEGKYLPVPHCIYETEGWKLHPAIEKALKERHDMKMGIHDDLVLYKRQFGMKPNAYDFTLGELVAMGRVESFTLCGTCTDICVVSNALMLKALYPNIEVNIRADVCAAVDEEGQRAALKVMERCQCNILEG